MSSPTDLHGSGEIESEEVHRADASGVELPDRRHGKALAVLLDGSVVITDGVQVCTDRWRHECAAPCDEPARLAWGRSDARR